MANPLQRVLDRLPKARQYRQVWRAQCPLHGGKSRNSLSVHETADGKVLLHCWGGCETAAIVRHIGLEMHDLFPPSDPPRQGVRPRAKRHHPQTTSSARPTVPEATASTLYAALYLGAILAHELPTINLDENMGCYLQVCEDLGRAYVDHGHATTTQTWRTWTPSLQHQAPALLAMMGRLLEVRR